MAGRSSKPVQLLKMEGKSHRTKEELEFREKAEKALYTGTDFNESPAVKSDPIAHQEFLRLKELYKDIDYVDGLDEQVINRYCLLISQEQKLYNIINSVEDPIEQIGFYKELNKMQSSILKLEDRLFLNPTARVRAIPKKPVEENKESPMAQFLKRRGHNG